MKKLLSLALGLCLAGSLAANAADADAKPEPKTKRAALTEEQKTLIKDMTTKYDTDKDGKLSKDEADKISAEDKEKLKTAHVPLPRLLAKKDGAKPEGKPEKKKDK